MKLLFGVLVLCWLETCLAIRYDGYNAIVAGPMQSKMQIELIDAIVDRDTRTRKVLLLQDHVFVDSYVDLLVAPDRVRVVVDALQQAAIPHQIQDTDVQKALDETMEENQRRREEFIKSGKVGPPEFYMENDEMEEYIRGLGGNADNAEYFSFDNSFEGREMYYVVINGDRSDLPGIWLDAGTHCREWLAHATAIHILETILTDSSAEAVDLRENYRVYIAPNLNPDGYVYSWTTDRYWRKNRSNNGGCGGVDLNRNYDVNYDLCGTSQDPCSDTFSGPSAASEVETQAVVTAVRDIVDNDGGLELFISMHSYAQFWLVPWGGSELKPADYAELKCAAGNYRKQMVVAATATQAIADVNGLEFTAGTVPDLLYCAAGGSFDWAKNDGTLAGDGAGIKYAYTPELRPDYGCCGLPGFNPPATSIDPSGREIFAGFYAAVKAVA